MTLQLSEAERHEVLRFLNQWKHWVEAGALGKHPVFKRHRGLCTSARYAVNEGMSRAGLTVWLTTMLTEDFPDNPMYPFNGEVTLGNEVTHKTTHINPGRIAWVDAKLKGTGFDRSAADPVQARWKDSVVDF